MATVKRSSLASSNQKTRGAAKKLAEALNVLVEHGICDSLSAAQAALTATPQGGTPERRIVLDVLR